MPNIFSCKSNNKQSGNFHIFSLVNSKFMMAMAGLRTMFIILNLIAGIKNNKGKKYFKLC